MSVYIDVKNCSLFFSTLSVKLAQIDKQISCACLRQNPTWFVKTLITGLYKHIYAAFKYVCNLYASFKLIQIKKAEYLTD